MHTRKVSLFGSKSLADCCLSRVATLAALYGLFSAIFPTAAIATHSSQKEVQVCRCSAAQQWASHRGPFQGRGRFSWRNLTAKAVVSALLTPIKAITFTVFGNPKFLPDSNAAFIFASLLLFRTLHHEKEQQKMQILGLQA